MSMKRLKNVIFFAGFPLLLIAPWFIVGLNIWGWLMTAIVGTVLGWEAFAKWQHGKTISTIFHEYLDAQPKCAYAVLTSATIAWALLMLHLADYL